MRKTFIDHKNGSAYRLSEEYPGEVEFAPLYAKDDSFNFEEEGGIVEVWTEDEHPGHAQAEKERVLAGIEASPAI